MKKKSKVKENELKRRCVCIYVWKEYQDASRDNCLGRPVLITFIVHMFRNGSWTFFFFPSLYWGFVVTRGWPPSMLKISNSNNLILLLGINNLTLMDTKQNAALIRKIVNNINGQKNKNLTLMDRKIRKTLMDKK